MQNKQNRDIIRQQEELKRDILESAIIGQEKAKATQVELYRQGQRLRASFYETKRIADQTETTGKAIDELIKERDSGIGRNILYCCFGKCFPCCFRDAASRLRKLDNARISISSQDDNDDTEAETLIRFDRLKKILAESKHKDTRDKVSWRRTLEPLSGIRGDIWYRQIDICLTRLQEVSEEMGDSLDEQIKLAQMLSIYLNYGAEQVIQANERLKV